MNLCRATVRLILALMMISMLGLSLWGAKSGSHVLLPHTHQLDASTDDADAIESSELSATHLHKHNPGDHTHDIPLLPVPFRVPGVTADDGYQRQTVRCPPVILPLPDKPPKAATSV